METAIQQFEAHFSKGDYDGAGKLFNNLLSEKQTDQDEAEAIVDFAELFMDIQDRIGQEYRTALKETVKSFQRIKKAETAVNDKVRLAEVRGSLNM